MDDYTKELTVKYIAALEAIYKLEDVSQLKELAEAANLRRRALLIEELEAERVHS